MCQPAGLDVSCCFECAHLVPGSVLAHAEDVARDLDRAVVEIGTHRLPRCRRGEAADRVVLRNPHPDSFSAAPGHGSSRICWLPAGGNEAAPRSDRILMVPAVVQRNITTRPWPGWSLHPSPRGVALVVEVSGPNTQATQVRVQEGSNTPVTRTKRHSPAHYGASVKIGVSA